MVQPPGLIFDAVHPLVFAHLHLQHLGVGGDDGYGSFQFVAGVGDELALLFHALLHGLGNSAGHEQHQHENGCHAQYTRAHGHQKDGAGLAQLLIAADGHDCAGAVGFGEDLVPEIINFAVGLARVHDGGHVVSDVAFGDGGDKAVVYAFYSAVGIQHHGEKAGFKTRVRSDAQRVEPHLAAVHVGGGGHIGAAGFFLRGSAAGTALAAAGKLGKCAGIFVQHLDGAVHLIFCVFRVYDVYGAHQNGHDDEQRQHHHQNKLFAQLAYHWPLSSSR